MKNILFPLVLCFYLTQTTAQNPKDYIKNIPGFYNSSSFPAEQYVGLSWQEFYALPTAKQILHPENVDIRLFNAALFFASNKIRLQYGKSALSYDEKLCNAAMTHSYNMVKQNFFSHVNPRPGPFADMKSRIENYGYVGQALGENIAKAYVDLTKSKTYVQVAEEVIKQFYNSPPHRANMLKSSFQSTGQGGFFYSKAEYGQYWYFCVTQDYGTPWK